ncbi:hypothetical protein WN944_028516 [Citrus x changshan-huyou]|uniref:Ubiquitin-like protease family profile domain-containing protein n=1 Tax=Citrus x changshan-huyou TaxID=2935761 RepID=A0AAP0LNZ3_9ROSI
MDSSNIPQDDDAHSLGTNERKKRGPTMMPKIVKGTSNGKKFHVNFNYKGQPVGKMRPKLSSMVGVWSRSLAKFDVGEDRKRFIMLKFNKTWKTFKYKLTAYVKEHIDEPELLRHPPTSQEWGSIPQEDWNQFVESRKSVEFKNLSESQTERRNKVTLNHGLSRGGYVGLEERIQRATGVYALVPREDLWVEARKTKNGEFRSEDVKEKAEKITDLKKQVADGEISFQPGEDILTMALEKPEHQGRVQATGDGVTITSYFGRAKRKSIAIDIENIVEEKVDKIGTFCKLALGDDLNIVAQGTVFMDNEPNATVHGIPLASTDVRVSIDVAFQKNAILPRPVRDELILVSHAIGSIVAWPKKIVITSNNEVSKFVSQDVASSSMPPIVKSLFSFAKNVMHPSGSIIINFDPNMFASTTEMMFLGRDDILQFCRMEQISVSVIKLYMRLLFENIKRCNLEKRFKFVDPEFFANGSAHDSEEKAKKLGDIMESIDPTQLIIFPYNESAHWMLTVIDSYEGQCYFFDSIGHDPRQNLKELINSSLRMFSTAHGKINRKHCIWKPMKCPRQPKYVEHCGYYVMKYMWDIVANTNVSIPEKFVKIQSYTQREIDEVRCEWARYTWQLAATYEN